MWEIAINKHKNLMKTRVGPQWWSANIIDASRDLKLDEDWRIFYMYLVTPPADFDPTLRVPIIGDLKTLPIIPPYPEGFESVSYPNGKCEVITMVNRVQNEDSDDEKTV